MAEYHLQVIAKDGGGLSCTMEVYITITDVNDNAPQFSTSQYVVSIPEDAEINTLLTRVAAVDYDLGMHYQRTLSMKMDNTCTYSKYVWNKNNLLVESEQD